MSSTALEIAYELNLPSSFSPASTATPLTQASSTSRIELDTTSAQSHLASLIQALKQARDEANAHLTVWKDAVKDLDSEKQIDKRNKARNDEEPDDDDEDEAAE
ncbi:hypothetical protein OIO90_003866 [Microbotryomycetes sp. JL221]|nr:hypothetical protein OIO90_003866 [Microbotryomycetes sp. JL221]